MKIMIIWDKKYKIKYLFALFIDSMIRIIELWLVWWLTNIINFDILKAKRSYLD